MKDPAVRSDERGECEMSDEVDGADALVLLKSQSQRSA